MTRWAASPMCNGLTGPFCLGGCAQQFADCRHFDEVLTELDIAYTAACYTAQTARGVVCRWIRMSRSMLSVAKHEGGRSKHQLRRQP